MILIFIASLNENVKLANKISSQLKEENIENEIVNLVDMNLPLFDTNKKEKDGIPQEVLTLSKKMKNADGFILVSPEYNFSVPPVLLNMIAWVSRISDDFREFFLLKKIQLATHSGIGGNDLFNSLRVQFSRLGSVVMPREIRTTYEVTIDENSLKKILKQFIDLKVN